MLEESDLLGSDLAARSFPPADRAEFTQLAGLRQYLVADSLPQLNPADRATYNHFVTPQTAQALTHLENLVIHGRSAHGLPPVQPMPWVSTVTAYSTNLGKALQQAGASAAIRADNEGNSIDLRLILAGGPGPAGHHRLDPVLLLRRPRPDPPAARAAPVRPGAGQRPAAQRHPAAARRPERRRRGGGARRWSPARTRSTRSARPSRPSRPPPSRPPSTRPACGTGSATCSATWPGAARCCCTGSCGCWTAWSAGPASPVSWRTCSGSTT